MFSGGFRGQKLKTSLRLSINRLKLMEKKKTEMAQKARKEIADFISLNKYDRARIRVEHIIREDYLVEAMELIEMYCDLLLARFGLIETMKYCDEGLVEAVSTIIWAAPRLSTDCLELKTVSDQLTLKYGKEFGMQARSNATNTVNERLIHKLSPDAPPKLLVERYLIEIAKNYNVPFEPDPEIMMSEGIPSIDSKEFNMIGEPNGAIGFGSVNSNNSNNYGPPPPSGGGYPGGGSNFSGGGGDGGDLPSKTYPPPSQNAPYPPSDVPPYPMDNRRSPLNDTGPQLPPYSASNPNPTGSASGGNFLNAPPPGSVGGSSIPDLPNIPSNSLPGSNTHSTVGGQSESGDDIDFDDLSRRFLELKKK